MSQPLTPEITQELSALNFKVADWAAGEEGNGIYISWIYLRGEFILEEITYDRLSLTWRILQSEFSCRTRRLMRNLDH